MAILGLDNPKLTTSHFVARDELGVVDPAVRMPDHLELDDWLRQVREHRMVVGSTAGRMNRVAPVG